MSHNTDLDRARGAALDRIERSERHFRLAIYGAAAWETLFLVTFIVLADFSNRLHLLLLIATVGSYSLVAIGLVALGAHVSWNAQRILRAFELLDGPPEGDTTPQN